MNAIFEQIASITCPVLLAALSAAMEAREVCPKKPCHLITTDITCMCAECKDTQNVRLYMEAMARPVPGRARL